MDCGPRATPAAGGTSCHLVPGAKPCCTPPWGRPEEAALGLGLLACQSGWWEHEASWGAPGRWAPRGTDLVPVVTAVSAELCTSAGSGAAVGFPWRPEHPHLRVPHAPDTKHSHEDRKRQSCVLTFGDLTLGHARPPGGQLARGWRPSRGPQSLSRVRLERSGPAMHYTWRTAAPSRVTGL